MKVLIYVWLAERVKERLYVSDLHIEFLVLEAEMPKN